MRTVVTAHSFTGTETFGNRTPEQMGLPRFDVFVARSAERETAYMIGGDAGAVLGPLAASAPRVRASGAPQ